MHVLTGALYSALQRAYRSTYIPTTVILLVADKMTATSGHFDAWVHTILPMEIDVLDFDSWRTGSGAEAGEFYSAGEMWWAPKKKPQNWHESDGFDGEITKSVSLIRNTSIGNV